MARIESGHKPSDSPKSLKGRSSDSTNKWKIPHYYKRISQTSSSQKSGNNSNDLMDAASRKNSVTNFQYSPNINVMHSPRRVVSEGRSRNRSISSASPSISSTKKTSRKKGKSDMVFVNYTVQDDNNSSQQLTPLQQQEDVFKIETLSPTIHQSPKQYQPSGAQKSNRRRMLKIFSSSKDQKIVPASSPSNTDEASIALERSLSSSSIYSKSGINKKSYSSFLKYSKLNNNSKSTSNIEDTRNMKLSSQTAMPPLKENVLANTEIVPRSKNDPSLAQPPTSISKSKMLINNRNSMTQSINNQKQNKVFSNNGDKSIIDIPLTNTANYKVDPKNLGQIIPQYIEQKIPYSRPAEDNDASVAFSKLIYQKITDSNASTQSLITPPSSSTTTATNTTISNSTNTTTLPRVQNQRTASVTSLSSIGSRYSPIKTHSPARPRSSTRGSSGHRLSRDISTIYNANNALHDINPLLETDSFLDSQFPNNHGNTINNNPKRMSILSSASSSNVNKLGHRRKQESISDNFKFVSTFSNGNYSSNASTTSITTPNNTTTANPQIAVTPSGLLLTPPYVTPSMTQPPNFASSASTPSVTESYNAGGMMNSSTRQSVYSNIHQKNSNEALAGFNESLPIIKGIPKEHSTYASTDSSQNNMNEQTFASKNNNGNNFRNDSNANNNIGSNDTANVLGPDVLSFFVDSSANSSGMESLMANSLSTANSSIPQNSVGYDNNRATLPQGSQDNIGNGNTLFNTNNNNYGGNTDFTVDTNMMVHGKRTKDEQLLDQMYLEFDFENPDSFLHEQTTKLPINNVNDKISNPATNHNDDEIIYDTNKNISNEQVLMYHKDSTVTSFENASSNSAPSTVIENTHNNTSLNSLGNTGDNIGSAVIMNATTTNNTNNNNNDSNSKNNSYNNHTINLMHSRSNNPNQTGGNNLITPQFNDFISTSNNNNNTSNNNNMNNNNSMSMAADIPINYQDIDGLTNFFFSNIQSRSNS
ncbi:protein Bck2p [Monosporozyma servazzii]